ncbi:MAG TPA: hypothetical protein VNB22_11110 [Pyrinomonadaceae bacterium]|jgi:hypothetical protein|nr:hypothetical protein [Pyrinomonadaceae bacterium]
MTGKKKLKFIIFGVSLWILLIGVAGVFAQVDDVMVVRQKAKKTIRPKAKPVSKKINITRKVTIVRVEKKSRRNYKKPTVKKVVRTVQVPLLAAQLRLLSVDKEGKETEVNPIAAFTTNDRLRMSIKANQTGYLYVVRQASPEADGEIIFPTTLVNNGSNLVKANIEYVLPRNCPKEYVPEPRDCALQLFPYDQSPQEYFTLIFTRDSLVDLPNDVKNSRVSLANLMSAGKIEAKTMIDLIEDSGQDLVSQQGDTPFAIRIVNINPKDNEEIIETFVLSKMKK